LLANYATVVEDRRIISAKYCLPVPVFPFRPKLSHPATRSLCDSWATCYNYFYAHILASLLSKFQEFAGGVGVLLLLLNL